MAWRDCPPDISTEATAFLSAFETRPLSKFLLEVLEATFEGIPVSSSYKGSVSNAKVRLLGSLQVVSLYMGVLHVTMSINVPSTWYLVVQMWAPCSAGWAVDDGVLRFAGQSCLSFRVD